MKRSWFLVLFFGALWSFVGALGARAVTPLRVGPPVCARALSSEPLLAGVRPLMVGIPGNPFGVASRGRWSFVAQGAGQVAVVSLSGTPTLMREIELPPGAQPAGEALTPNGQYLLVADGIGVAVVSVVRAERGLKHAVLGQLYAGAASNEAYNTAIEVAASPDGDFAFASLEGAQALGVFDLRKALATQFRSSGLVGSIPMNYAPVGMAISPDGRWLYATSEGKSLASARGGTLSVIDLHKAEKEPSHSVVTRVDAGCDPVRVIASPTNDVVWVAARESNSVLAFSSTKLRADPQHARLAEVRVGKAPVGLLLLRNGTRLLVADSNRFGQPFQHGELSVIDTTAALANKPALIGAIPAGSFPRDMSLSISQHRVLVSNFASNALEAIDVTGIP